MRAIIAGDASPEHLNVVRTTARNYAGPGLANETARIEQGADFLDAYRRSQQQQERQGEQQRVGTRDVSRAVPSEITR